MRVFVAVQIDDQTRTTLSAAIDRLAIAVPLGVKWVEPNNLHITLKFLGEVDERELADLEDALATAAAAVTPFEASLKGLGAFPGTSKPRVVYGDMAAPSALADLAREVDQTLAGIGFPRETRPFTPHVTIGRVRSPRRKRKQRRKEPRAVGDTVRSALTQSPPVSCAPFRVEQLTLYQSVLGQHGPTYTVLTEVPLGA
ncbi:RNA 2',3'-cyclic phosphodiesterase [Planctomycetota bacterium]